MVVYNRYFPCNLTPLQMQLKAVPKQPCVSQAPVPSGTHRRSVHSEQIREVRGCERGGLSVCGRGDYFRA